MTMPGVNRDLPTAMAVVDGSISILTVNNDAVLEHTLHQMRQKDVQELPSLVQVTVNAITEQTAGLLGQVMQAAPNLSQLHIQQVVAEENVFSALVEHIKGMANLRELKLVTDSRTGRNYGPSIASLLEAQPQLTQLFISGMCNAKEKFAPVAEALGHAGHGKIKSLTFHYLKGGADSTEALAGVIDRLPALKRMETQYTDFTTEGFRPVAAALVRHGGIKEVNINGSPLGGEAGAEILLELIDGMKNLDTLDARYTDLGDEGIIRLSRRGYDTGNLKHIGLAEGNLSQEAAECFACDMLARNRTLNTLVLHCSNEGVLQGEITRYGHRSRSHMLTRIGQTVLSFQPRLQDNTDHYYKALESWPSGAWKTLGAPGLLQFDQLRRKLFITGYRASAPLGKPASDIYEAFIGGLPGLPPAGEGFVEALFAPAHPNGYCPLDNPRLVQDSDAVLRVMGSDGFTKDMFFRKTRMGGTFIDSLITQYNTLALVQMMNSKGKSVDEGWLLEADGEGGLQPTPFYAKLIAMGDAEGLFTRENWAGRDAGTIRRCMAHLPQEQKMRVPMTLLVGRESRQEIARGR